MPTLAANLLNDACDEAPARRKKKSITLGKGGPGSGPHPNMSSTQRITAAQKTHLAERAESKYNRTQNPEDKKAAGIAHRYAQWAHNNIGRNGGGVSHLRQAEYHEIKANTLGGDPK